MSKLMVITMSPEELDTLLERRLRIFLASNQTSRSEEPLMKVNEVARYLRVSVVTIHQWKKKGIIPFRRISSKIYFNKQDVVDALKKVEGKSKYV